MSTRRLVPLVAWVLGAAACSAARPEPGPAKLPHIGVDLPPSTRAYQEFEQGGSHTRTQVRFELDPDDIELLATRLPCRLGPVTSGPPKFALVVANTQPWYTPELARTHRGCDHERGRESASFLVELGDPRRAVVYGVIAFDWKE
jgi:hypothetical protein